MSSHTRSILLWVLGVALVIVAGAYFLNPSDDGAMKLPFLTDAVQVPCTPAELAATACTREYIPHCGGSGNTYSNRCMACSTEGETTARVGACTSSAEFVECTAAEKGNSACTLEYAPHCGDNGNTYSNRCMACASAGVTAVARGACH